MNSSVRVQWGHTVFPQRRWLVFGRGLEVMLGRPSVLHRPSACGTCGLSAVPFVPWTLDVCHGLVSRSFSARPAAFSEWTSQMNPGLHLVLDHVWSALHWWRNLLLSPCSPAQVLWDCVLVSESTALSLSSWVAPLHGAAPLLLPRGTTIHQIHIWGQTSDTAASA